MTYLLVFINSALILNYMFLSFLTRRKAGKVICFLAIIAIAQLTEYVIFNNQGNLYKAFLFLTFAVLVHSIRFLPVKINQKNVKPVFLGCMAFFLFMIYFFLARLNHSTLLIIMTLLLGHSVYFISNRWSIYQKLRKGSADCC